jgi:type IV pilus assembly protein PilE
MSNRNTSVRSLRHTGFSLIELMVAVLVIGILASIAVPTYTAQTRKSRRTEARTALLDLAGREERVLSVNNSYSALPTDVGYTGTTWGTGISVGSGYYTVVVAAPDTANQPGVTNSFLITATAVLSQANDAGCATLSVNQLGQQTATGTDSTNCWK